MTWQANRDNVLDDNLDNLGAGRYVDLSVTRLNLIRSMPLFTNFSTSSIHTPWRWLDLKSRVDFKLRYRTSHPLTHSSHPGPSWHRTISESVKSFLKVRYACMLCNHKMGVSIIWAFNRARSRLKVLRSSEPRKQRKWKNLHPPDPLGCRQLDWGRASRWHLSKSISGAVQIFESHSDSKAKGIERLQVGIPSWPSRVAQVKRVIVRVCIHTWVRYIGMR